MVVAWMQGSVPPAANLEQRPGRWVAEERWPSPRIAPLSLRAGRRRARRRCRPRRPGGSTSGSDQTVGLDGGAWCADAARPTCRSTSGAEDARSLPSRPRRSPSRSRSSGFPEARLALPADRPVALVSARLCEVRADGTSLLVTRGQLNLCHRDGHTPSPEPRRAGRGVRGHASRWTRSRTASRPAAAFALSVSPCYWPLAWPSPEEVTLGCASAPARELELPVRPPHGRGRAHARARPARRSPRRFPVEQLRAAVGRRAHRSPAISASGRTELVFDWDLRRPGAAPERPRLRGHVGRAPTPSSTATRSRPGWRSRTPRVAGATTGACASARPAS